MKARILLVWQFHIYFSFSSLRSLRTISILFKFIVLIHCCCCFRSCIIPNGHQFRLRNHCARILYWALIGSSSPLISNNGSTRFFKYCKIIEFSIGFNYWLHTLSSSSPSSQTHQQLTFVLIDPNFSNFKTSWRIERLSSFALPSTHLRRP